jgi:hypothetical protein
MWFGISLSCVNISARQRVAVRFNKKRTAKGTAKAVYCEKCCRVPFAVRHPVADEKTLTTTVCGVQIQYTTSQLKNQRNLVVPSDDSCIHKATHPATAADLPPPAPVAEEGLRHHGACHTRFLRQNRMH